ncbi:MAG: TerC family protein [Verrucomicrobia bacterium]|nr:TerC family protein [Verrucomicrobiota bacterium]
MIAQATIPPVHWTVWAGFVACVLLFLALDLGVFHRESHVVKFKEAFAWTLVWFALAMCFAGALVPWRGKQDAVEFVTGYVIELSLSMDNVFVIALIFAYFRVPPQFQHRVLFWGILGALVMRGVVIGLGTGLVARFAWTLYVFGAFLVYSGAKMLFADDEGVHPEKNPLIKLAQKLYPVSHGFEGQKFVTRLNGRRALTPLALTLVMVETSDLVFALDSIPAIFAVTTKPFIVFTSNVFAILGLRSLYFVLAGAIQYFHFLKYGLSLVLVFIGVKMLIDPHDQPAKWFQLEIPTGLSLAVVASIIVLAILFSVVMAKREKHSQPS